MRTIDADALKKQAITLVTGTRAWEVITVSDINNAPTVERPHGEWIKESSETGALGIKYTWVRCNRCGWNNSLVIPKNFCPNCGAEMKGGAKNEKD